MVAIFGFDGGISIFDALDFVLIFETMERDNEVLAAATNDYDRFAQRVGRTLQRTSTYAAP